MPKIYVSHIIPAAAAEVWDVIRDFNAMANWTDFVAESRIEQNLPSDQVGCIRNFTLRDGARIREKLLSLSDYDMSFTYMILDSPLGLENYVASLRLCPITQNNQTFAEWTAEFTTAPGREIQLAQFVSVNVFAAALTSLAAHVRG
ncbi:MAG: SRPBCC family protein [Alphaproteobacteria bacterium]|nr:SRPBCC family protein [Alphaproteobacteria bacterium]